MTLHLDVDALADVLAGGVEPEHLLGCARCRAALADVQRGTEVVRRQLGSLPPLTPPPGLLLRVDAARPPAGAVTTLPPAATRRNWHPLTVAAAAIIVLGGAALGVTTLAHRTPAGQTAASRSDGSLAAPLAPHAVGHTSSGRDYTGRASITAALPQLLAGAGTSGTAPLSAAGPSSLTTRATDPLARLRTSAGLAECLLALLPTPDPTVRPLVVDYARYRGAPAMIVVLTANRVAKLDVFVVGPGCSRANDSTLFYTAVDRP